MAGSVVATLLLARVRHAGVRWAVVALGVALAAVPPVLTQVVTRTTASAALYRGVAQLPPGGRTLSVSYSGLPDTAQLTAMDAAAAAQLGRLGSGPVRREMLFQTLADTHGTSFRLAGVDRLPSAVRLLSGRLPAACTPAWCEVVALDGASAPPAIDPSLGLVLVGRVHRTDPVLLGGTFDPGAAAPVVLADGVDRLGALTSLSSFGRSYGWLSPLDLRSVVHLGVDDWLARAADAGTQLAGVAPGLVLTAPDDVLREQAARAAVSSGRFGLLGGTTAVVLLVAAVVGGAALRRDHEAFTGALRRRGASRRLIGVLVTGEAVIAAVAGTVSGLLAGGAVAGLLAARAGLPPVGTAVSAVLGAWPSLGLLTAVAAVLIVAALALPAAPGSVGAPSAGVWRAVEGVAIACLAAAALLIARGGVTAGAGSSGSGSGAAAAGGAAGGSGGGVADPLLPALPALVLVAAGLLLARCWPAITRVAVRTVPRRAVAARLGLAAAGGRPLRPAATAAVLTASVAGAVFAAGYAATLDQGAADQAAYQVPLALRVLPAAGAAPPLDAATPALLATALPGSAVHGVTRTSASLRTGPSSGEGVELIGIDPAALPGVTRWTAVTGSGADPSDLARRLSTSAGSRPPALPAGRLLRVVTPSGPATVAVNAVVATPDGRERVVPLAVQAPSKTARSASALTGILPDLRAADGRSAALRLVAVTVALPVDAAERQLHALGEGNRDLARTGGTLDLGAVTVDGGPVRSAWRGWSTGTPEATLTPSSDGSSARVTYRLDTSAALLAAPGAQQDGPIPVLVDPQTAAAAGATGATGATGTTGVTGATGAITLLLDGQPFPARPVGVLDRFPTAGGQFAVMDAAALGRLIDRTEPGSASPSELWIGTTRGTASRPSGTSGAPSGTAAVTARLAAVGVPVDQLDVRGRDQVEAALRSDPVARAATGLLVVGALLALAVALAAVVLLVIAERTDDAATTYAWEADGVAPGTLRAALWWRALAVVVPAVPAGVLAGLALSGLTARLVAITATATAPVPPLRSGVGVGWGLLAVVAALLLTLAVAGAVAARALREPLPVRRLGWSR
jgi:hypothetical protein